MTAVSLTHISERQVRLLAVVAEGGGDWDARRIDLTVNSRFGPGEGTVLQELQALQRLRLVVRDDSRSGCGGRWAMTAAARAHIPNAGQKGQNRPVSERGRYGIQYVEIDQLSSELRIVGSDDPGLFLWAAQWLDEHRGFVVHAARFEGAPGPDDDTDLTATLVISMNHAGESPDGREPGQLGPWPHGVPPIPITFGRGPAL